jgi:hypothetical protein
MALHSERLWLMRNCVIFCLPLLSPPADEVAGVGVPLSEESPEDAAVDRFVAGGAVRSVNFLRNLRGVMLANDTGAVVVRLSPLKLQ